MASAEEILKELHKDDSDASDEDLQLPIVTNQKKVDPLQEEKQRHKENLMQDIYDQISDEEEEEAKE